MGTSKKSDKHRNEIKQIKDKESVIALITNYMKKDKNCDDITDENWERINELIDNRVDHVGYNYDMNLRNFELETLKFDNFFIYDKNNVIDYCSLDGIVGIIASSYSGKSSTIDCLLYSIFGTCSRGNPNDTINFKEEEMKTSVTFKINKDQYTIERVRTRHKNRSHETISFTKNGSNKTCETVDATNELITKTVGRYEDFTNIVIMLQKNCDNIVDLSSVKRKELICKISKIDILNDIYNSSKQLKTQIKKDVNQSDAGDPEKIKEEIIKTDKKFGELVAQLNKSHTKIEKIVEKLTKLKLDMAMMNYDVKIEKDVQSKEKRHKYLKEKLKSLEDELNSHRKHKSKLARPDNTDMEECRKKIKELDNTIINLMKKKKNVKLNLSESKLLSLKKSLLTTKTEKKEELDTYNRQKQDKFDNNCKYCKINSKEFDELYKNKTEQEIKTIDEKLDDIVDDLDNIQKNIKAEEEIEKTQKDKAEIEDRINMIIKIEALDSQILQDENMQIKYEQEIKVLEDDINQNNKRLSNKDRYLELQEEYEKLESEKESIDVSIKKTERDRIVAESKIIRTKIELEEAEKQVKLREAKENDINLLDMIVKKLGGEEGIINVVLENNILPTIEKCVNDILKQLSGFQIKIKKYGMGVNITKTVGDYEINIETNSGCEEFLCNLAFRFALAKLNSSIKSNMLIIDEAFRFCDTETVDKIPVIFDYIRKEFKFAIIISHDERISKMYDKEYEITKKRGKSHIEMR